MSAPFVRLASASPRRRTLLEQIGVHYQLLEIAIEETWDGHESPRDHVLRLALEKAQAGWRCLAAPQAAPVLGADTVVVVDGKILGKPANQKQGLAMLEQLSGRSHEVLTAVAVVNGSRHGSRLSISTVTFAPTTAAQRAAYWATGESHDKAGGYAIQGRAAAFIVRLEGSYSGVMGLPLFETAALLAEFGVDIFIAPV